MTARVVVTARCPAKGHPLAEVLGVRDGPLVRVRQIAVGHAKAGRVYYLPGGPSTGPLGDATTSYIGMCKCGRPHLVRGQAFAAALAAGDPVVIATPLR